MDKKHFIIFYRCGGLYNSFGCDMESQLSGKAYHDLVMDEVVKDATVSGFNTQDIGNLEVTSITQII